MEDTDLQLAPPADETNPLVTYGIAAVVMIIVGVAVFMLYPRKTAEVTVQKVALYGPPAVAGTPDPVMYPGSTKPAEDDLYVVATVKVTDKLTLPIFPTSPSASVTTADGTVVDGQFVAAEDVARLEREFPALTPMLSDPGATPIKNSETIAPGGTRVGTVILYFPKMTEAAWHAKKSASLTINLLRQKSTAVSL